MVILEKVLHKSDRYQVCGSTLKSAITNKHTFMERFIIEFM